MNSIPINKNYLLPSSELEGYQPPREELVYLQEKIDTLREKMQIDMPISIVEKHHEPHQGKLKIFEAPCLREWSSYSERDTGIIQLSSMEADPSTKSPDDLQVATLAHECAHLKLGHVEQKRKIQRIIFLAYSFVVLGFLCNCSNLYSKYKSSQEFFNEVLSVSLLVVLGKLLGMFSPWFDRRKEKEADKLALQYMNINQKEALIKHFQDHSEAVEKIDEAFRKFEKICWDRVKWRPTSWLNHYKMTSAFKNVDDNIHPLVPDRVAMIRASIEADKKAQ